MSMLGRTLTRRDAFLILLGAFSMHIWNLMFRESPYDQSILVSGPSPNHGSHHPQQVVDVDAILAKDSDALEAVVAFTTTTTMHDVVTQTVTEALTPKPTPDATKPPKAVEQEDHDEAFPHTSIIAHAPGWTLFKNLYMSNGTLYIFTSSPKTFPEIRLMTSTGLPASNTPENIASREPTRDNMDFITPEDALIKWGGGADSGETNRVWAVEGNTLLFNDPGQFLRHYYHLVAELFFGVQAFWHGAFSEEETSPQTAFSSSTSLHPAPPQFDRVIFAHSNADGWRDNPGFNSYFIRAAFPSLTIEHEEDWDDRIEATKEGTRVWRFPTVLLADRSAAHRGRVCGSLTQRTASEPWEAMRKLGRLRGRHVGGWWEPVRQAIWEFAGVPSQERGIRETGDAHVPKEDFTIPGFGEGADEILNGVGIEAQKYLPMPDKIIITYISRQGTSRRKLIQDEHDVLVDELKELVKRKNEEAEKNTDDDSETNPKRLKWELNVLEAEKMSKDEQIRVAAKTTIMLGVHGNGLTHLVWMKPTRVSTVIEMFYPNGFAHDYQWTSRALGMAHFGVWNDTHFTHPNKPPVDYPEGFQGNKIPIHGPTVAKLIEDRVEGRL